MADCDWLTKPVVAGGLEYLGVNITYPRIHSIKEGYLKISYSFEEFCSTACYIPKGLDIRTSLILPALYNLIWKLIYFPINVYQRFEEAFKFSCKFVKYLFYIHGTFIDVSRIMY